MDAAAAIWPAVGRLFLHHRFGVWSTSWWFEPRSSSNVSPSLRVNRAYARASESASSRASRMLLRTPTAVSYAAAHRLRCFRPKPGISAGITMVLRPWAASHWASAIKSGSVSLAAGRWPANRTIDAVYPMQDPTRSLIRWTRGTAWDSVDEYEAMAKPTVIGQAPGFQPRDVYDVKQLGEELRTLRLSAERPNIGDDQLTLRELARLTGIPRSTLGNAESGRIVPRAAVVYQVARACGLADDEVEALVSARNRIAQERHQIRRACLPDRGAAAALVQQVRNASRPTAVRRLQRLPARSVADCLEMMKPGFAAPYLAAMEPTFAAACLNLLPSDVGAELLNCLDPAEAAELLRLEEFALSVMHLHLMQISAAAAAIGAMPTEAATMALNSLSGDTAVRVVKELPAKIKIALALTQNLSEQLTLELLFTLERRRTVELLIETPARRAISLLERLPEDPAAGLFAELGGQRQLALLAEAKLTLGARLLIAVPVLVGSALADSMPLNAVAGLLASADAAKAAQLLERVEPERRKVILAAMPASATAAVNAAWKARPRSVRYEPGLTFDDLERRRSMRVDPLSRQIAA